MSNNKWIKCLRESNDSDIKLFCFPFAGGSATAYRLWPDYLQNNIDIYSIQLPGREERIKDQLLYGMDECVEIIKNEITSFLTTDFVFFGHSMGAIMAFELACTLQENGSKKPDHVIVSARGAAHMPDPDPVIHDLSDEDFIQGIRDYNGTPEAVLQNRELMDFFLPILRADFTVSETYRFKQKTKLNCPITAIYGCDEIKLNKAHIDRWCELTESDFSAKMFSGGHFFIQENVIPVMEFLNNIFSKRICNGTKNACDAM